LDSKPVFLRCDKMRTRNLLLIVILIELVLFGIFDYLSIDPTYGGVSAAIVAGILFGKFLGSGSIKPAFIFILAYNLIFWVLTFLFTSEGKLMLQSGSLVISVFIGTVLVLAFIYSIIGSFVSFVVSNLTNNKQDEGL
jgi:hypothetical protein